MYIHRMKYYSDIKMNEILPFTAIRAGQKGALLSGIRQRQIPCDLTNIWNLKIIITTKQK